MVNNLFCDKTGTLTKNILVFKCLAFEGKLLEVEKDLAEYSELIKRFVA